MRYIFLSIGYFLLFFQNAGYQDTAFGQDKERVKILMLGDSLTAGYGIDKKKAYPALVEKQLQVQFPKKQIEVMNGGISGSTSQSGLSRLKWQIKAKPTHLFLALGANDGLRGQKVDNLESNLKNIIDFAQKSNLKVMIAGMQMPPNYGKEYTDAFQNTFVSVAKEKKIPIMPFLLNGVAGEVSLNLGDGIHPNEAGHEIIAKNVFAFIKENL